MPAPSGQAASTSWEWYLTRFTRLTLVVSGILKPDVSRVCWKVRSRHR